MNKALRCLIVTLNRSSYHYKPVNGERVTRVLDWFVLTRGCPEVITTDNGPEFSGIILDGWACNNNVRLDFIKPGKPVQNAFIESFNGRLRHECLNQHYFVSFEEAKKDYQELERRV